MATKKLIIAYSGSLDAYNGNKSKKHLSSILKWFWTYKHNTVDSSTRSAYYLIKAVRILKDNYNIQPNQIGFQFWGNINPLNKTQSEKEGVSDFFEFGAYLSKAESLERLAEADLLFLPLEKSNTSEMRTLFIPGKLFEYLHTGKPILGLCETSDCKTILENSGIGICCAPDNSDEIAKTLNKILKNEIDIKLIKANHTYIQSFSFIKKTEELAKVFDKLGVE